MTKAVWFGGSVDGSSFGGVAGRTLCGRELNTIGRVLGGFWAGIARTTTGQSRSSLDQARMQLLQQLLAAVLNRALGASPSGDTSIGQAKAAYCGTDERAIRKAAGAMSAFDASGEAGPFAPGAHADGAQAKADADRAFWDVLP